MAPDAIVIGAGPNGLVAANMLADAGWSILVLEANPEPGGAVRTAEVTAPGFRNDLFSAFYPFTAASPVIRDLDLGRYGLRWTHAPTVLANARPDAEAAVLSRDLDVTVRSLDAAAEGDGDRYRQMFDRWCRLSDPLMSCLLRPFPPIRHAARLLSRTKLAGAVELARLALLPVRRLIEEERLEGENAALLFAANALHADLTPDTPGSGLFGWMLTLLGQQYGFPVPVGGASQITQALVRRANAGGAELQCSRVVRRVLVSSGRVAGVEVADGTRIACRAVLADCDATTLMLDMVGTSELPAHYASGIRRMQRAASTFKIDWALDSPVPWTDELVIGAGTVHIADSVDELSTTAAQISMHAIPDRPFLLVGQMTTSDPTRSPPGTEAMWAYTHVPQDATSDAGGEGVTSAWNESDVERFADRMERRIERHAPGFTSRIVARTAMSPRQLEQLDRNLVGGDIGGGTAQLHQQLVFRPLNGWARPETPIKGLYLASASAHPGGAVHGACGANAARAALLHHPVRRLARRAGIGRSA
jgi:phytoene dehydrogenase-like protein